LDRERLKVAREKEEADKTAERECQERQEDSGKAIQLSQKGKGQASRAALSNNKRQKRVGSQLNGAQV
jgi:hypothetical protein